MQDDLPAGLHRITVSTREPVYCTLQLALQGAAETPISVFLDRLTPCGYRKTFSITRAAIGLDLEIEPRTNLCVLESVDIEPASLGTLIWSRPLNRFAAPARLLQKARQVLSGRHSLAFSGTGSADEGAIYEAWKTAFEGPLEQRRIDTALQGLTDGGLPKLLWVFMSSSSADRSLRAMLGRTRSCGPVGTALLAIEVADRPLAAEVREALEACGVRVVASGPGQTPLRLILEQAEDVGACAFAYIEHGRWSDFAASMVVLELLSHPSCLAVTGDSDRVRSDGKAVPIFKPRWSPVYQHETDYVRGAVAFRAGQELAHCCGLDADASSSRSLLGQLAQPDRVAVHHVPRILLHEGSAPEPELRRPALVGAISTSPLPATSVIIPTKNNPHLLAAAARSVLACADAGLELIIVDNGGATSKQKTQLERLAREGRVRIVRDSRPFNFSALINTARQFCRGDMLVLLNDDVRSKQRDWLAPLVRAATMRQAGCVGTLLLYPDGRIQHAGIVLGVLGVAGHAFRHLRPNTARSAHRLQTVHEVSAVTAACLAVRTKIFDEVGGFDEELPVTLNDVDFCLRVRERGYSNLMLPQVQLVHEESATRGLDITAAQADRLQRETAYFMARWKQSVVCDPYYSPHLTLAREDYGPRDI
jgi:GT2 family glycosyltransferase